MNVLLVCYDYSLAGGSERVMYRLYRELSREMNVKMVSLYCERTETQLDDSEVEYVIKRKGSLKTDIFATLRKLGLMAKKNRTDIMVSVGVSAAFFVCVTGKLNGVKTIACEHSNLSNRLYNTWQQNLRRKVALRLCSKFVTLTETDMHDYCHFFPQYKDKLTSIYNWVDMEELDNQHCYDLSSKKIVTVCRIDRVKGLEYSIEAFNLLSNEFPEWTWEVYGDGDEIYQSELERKIAEMKLDAFCFKGYCNDPRMIYKHAAIYGCTSLYEGLPLSLLEAKVNHVPIVSFACKTGPREIIDNGINGFLVKTGDVEALKNKLSMLMKNDRLRKKMSADSNRNINRFSKETIIRKWKELFREVMN